MQNCSRLLPAAAAFAALTTLLTGCSSVQMKTSGETPFGADTVAPMHGALHGGQQPIVGATIQLYAAGMTGYGSAATPLLPTSGGSVVTTDSGGYFTLPTYTCPSNSYVYLTSAGGNPQVNGNANPDIALLALLGSCATIKANAASEFLDVNEVTTVAGVWATQQFIGITAGTPLTSAPGGSGSPSFSIGTSSTNMQGLINAFGIAKVLSDPFNGGQSPGNNTLATATNVEYWQVNTLADILASCVNSDPSGGGTACSSLFTAAKAGSTPPADTLQAAYMIATNPGNNVQALFALAGSTPPFQPADNYVNDWTIGFTVGNRTGQTDLFSPFWIAFDSYGNAWVTNQNGGTGAGFVTEFDPQGNWLTTVTNYNLGSSASPTLTNIATQTLAKPFFVTVDPSNNAWVAERSGNAVFRIPASGGAGSASSGGGAGAYGLSTGTGTLPSAMTIDGNGVVWTALQGTTYSATFGTANNQGVAGINANFGSGSGPLTGGFMAQGAGATSTSSYSMVADNTSTSTYGAAPFLYIINNQVTCSGVKYGTIWNFFAGSGTITGSGSNTTVAQGNKTPANLFGDAGQACSGANTSLPTVNVTYNSSNYTVPTLYQPYGAAVDGQNNLWVLNTGTNVSGYATFSLAKITPSFSTNASTGALVTGVTTNVFTGGGLPSFATPEYIAIDGGNNVWIDEQASTVLSSFAEFSSNGTALSPGAQTQIRAAGTLATGWYGGNTGTSTGRKSQSRRGLAIDLSGNVWDVDNSSAGNTIFVLVGAAVPTVTPTSLALKNGTVGTRP